MAELLDEAPRRALAVYAHPDDPDVSCGGTLARWAGCGTDVQVLVCTRGDKGTTDPSSDNEALSSLRRAEGQAAAEALGISERHQLDYPDGELAEDEGLRAVLVSWVRRLKPDCVLGPDPTAVFFGEQYFNHRDHRVLGFAVLDAVAPAAGLPRYFPEAGPAHSVATVLLSGTLEPTVWVDVSDTIDQKLAAVACHRSQFGSSGDGEWARDAVRSRAEEDGGRAGVAFAEGFRRLRLGG